MSEGGSVFERNPLKTIFSVVLVFFIFVDFTAGSILAYKRSKKVAGIPSSYYHHDLRKNNCTTSVWGRDYVNHKCTNSLGFVDFKPRKVELKKKPGVKRLLFIGDSFLEGVSGAYADTFGGQATAALARENYDVLNAGVSSYSPRLYYLKVKHLLEKTGLEFDHLYVYIDISDIQDEIGYETFVPDKTWYILVREGYFLWREHSVVFPFLVDRFRPIHSIKAWTADGPGAKDLVKWKDEKVYQAEKSLWTEENAPEWRDRGLKLAGENMARLIGLCKSRGIGVTIAVYPWPVQVRAGRLDSLQAVFWKRFAGENGAGFIDYFPYFIGRSGADAVIGKYFLEGDTHWNREGNKLVADIFLDLFKKDRTGKIRPL